MGRRRPRSRTIQAIFPPAEELLRESRLPPTISELPEQAEPKSSIPGNNRRSMDSRLSAEERTHRAEVIARARGESITSTSGAAPVSIRLPGRDRSQVAEAVHSAAVVEEPEKRRRRSASITLSLAAKARRSKERGRVSGDRSPSGSVSSAAGPSTTRTRAKTVGGPAPVLGRNRAGSVGLMSYFGIGNGIEETMQSREDEKRDLEKGDRGGGQEYSRMEEPLEEAEEEHHEDEVVEHLDVIGERSLQEDLLSQDSLSRLTDPEISAVSHLQNFANSVMVPYFPELYNRRPTLSLPGTAAAE